MAKKTKAPKQNSKPRKARAKARAQAAPAAADPYAVTPSTADDAADQAAVAFAAGKARDLLAHLKAAHGADPLAQRLLVSQPRVVLLPPYAALQDGGSWLYGKFWYWSGALEISPRERTGALRSRPDLLMTLVHELAHAATAFAPVEEHGREWADALRWLAGVATRELGWDLTVPCRYCGKYALCAEFCRSCRREPVTDACRRPAARPALPPSMTPAFADYPADTRRRVCSAAWPYPWVAGLCAAAPVA